MSKCYHCRGDGRDPDIDYLLEFPVCEGSGEINGLFDDDDDDEDLQSLMDRDRE